MTSEGQLPDEDDFRDLGASRRKGHRDRSLVCPPLFLSQNKLGDGTHSHSPPQCPGAGAGGGVDGQRGDSAFPSGSPAEAVGRITFIGA